MGQRQRRIIIVQIIIIKIIYTTVHRLWRNIVRHRYRPITQLPLLVGMILSAKRILVHINLSRMGHGYVRTAGEPRSDRTVISGSLMKMLRY